MKKKCQWMLLSFLFFVLIVPLTNLYADDHAGIGDPNDPNDDNACYPGGTLYRENGDGCPTEWYWKAGWYLQQVEYGKLDAKEVPEEFQSAMPPVNETPAVPVLTICHNTLFFTAAIGAEFQICLGSDGKGYGINSPASNPHREFEYSIAAPDAAVCPLAPDGAIPFGPPEPISHFMTQFNFTSDDLAQLGFQNNTFCSYGSSSGLDLDHPVAKDYGTGIVDLSNAGCLITKDEPYAILPLSDWYYLGAPVRIIALNLSGYEISPDGRSAVPAQVFTIPKGTSHMGTYTLNGGSTANLRIDCY